MSVISHVEDKLSSTIVVYARNSKRSDTHTRIKHYHNVPVRSLLTSIYTLAINRQFFILSSCDISHTRRLRTHESAPKTDREHFLWTRLNIEVCHTPTHKTRPRGVRKQETGSNCGQSSSKWNFPGVLLPLSPGRRSSRRNPPKNKRRVYFSLCRDTVWGGGKKSGRLVLSIN